MITEKLDGTDALEKLDGTDALEKVMSSLWLFVCIFHQSQTS